MRNRLWSTVAVAALAGTLVLLLPGTSEAQRRGGGGGYGGGRSGVSIGIGTGYGGYGGYRGYGYGSPYGYGYGRGINIGIGSGYGGYGWGYGGYGTPYYGNYATITPSYYNDYASNPQTVTNQAFYPQLDSTSSGGAHIRVIVAPDAEVWFDGSATQQRGEVREFETPALDPNRSFTYKVRARWNQNGQVMDQTRDLQVQGGRSATVNFFQGQQQPQFQQQQPPVQQQQPQVQPPQQNQVPPVQQKAIQPPPPQKLQQQPIQ